MGVKFTRDDLLRHFTEAFNKARSHLTSSGTSTLTENEWEVFFLQVEEKINTDIKVQNIDTLDKLKKYLHELSIEWANAAFRASWSEVLNYKEK